MTKKKQVVEEEGYGEVGTPDFVSQTLVNQYRARKDVQRELNSRVPDGSDLDDIDIVNYIRLKRRQQVEEGERTARLVQTEYKINSRNVKKRMEAYKKAFDIQTPNDLFSIEQLAWNEESIDCINALIEKYRDDVDRESNEKYKSLVKERDDLVRRNLEWQKILGIDAKARTETKQKKSADELRVEEIEAANQFIEQELAGGNLVCPQCHTAYGWLFSLFRELRFGYFQECGCQHEVALEKKKYLYIAHGAEVPVLLDRNTLLEIISKQLGT